MDGNCNGAEATPQDAAQTSKDKPDDEAVFRGGSETQQNHRQRAQAAITSAPQHTGSSDPHASTKPDTSSATSRQSADKASTSAVSNSETSHTDLQQQKRQPSAFAAQFPPVSQESPDSSQLAASTSQSTMHDIADLSSTEQQLEAKLSALTDRLHAAEQAAGQHSELQQQLQELKQAKNALQADMKQFTEHISSMLTTLQSQVSRLLLPGFSQGSTAQQTADQSPANKGSSSQGSLSTTPLQWHLESHGAVPSPLARHRIFSSQTASSPRALADCGSTSAANVSMMRGGVASMSDQAASQPSTGQSAAAGAQEPGSSDDCIFDDEVGLPSFAQMATSSSVAQLPSTESYSQSARTQTAHPWLEQLGGSQSQASQLQTAQSRQAHFQSSEANDPAVGHPHQLQSVRLSNKASEPELQQQQSQRVAGMHQQPLMAQTPLQSLPLPSQRFWHMPAAQEPSHRWYSAMPFDKLPGLLCKCTRIVCRFVTCVHREKADM